MATPQTRLPSTVHLKADQLVALGILAGRFRFVSNSHPNPVIMSLQDMAHQQKLPLQVSIQLNPQTAIGLTMGAAVSGVRSLLLLTSQNLVNIIPAIKSAVIAEIPLVVACDFDCLIDLSALADFGGVILNSGSVIENFLLLQDAANLAEQYQLPVIIILAQGDEVVTKASALKISTVNRGQLLTAKQAAKFKNYHRYQVDSSGISPRKIPGQPGAPALVNVALHDSLGCSTNNVSDQKSQHHKRQAKLDAAATQMLSLKLFGPANAPIMMVCSGGEVLPALAAAQELAADDINCSVLQILSLAPFPIMAVSSFVRPIQHAVVLESSQSGLSRLLSQHTTLNLPTIILDQPIDSKLIKLEDQIRCLFTLKGAAR